MVKVAFPTSVAVTKAGIHTELKKAQAVLEGNVDSSNLLGNGVQITEIPSTLVSDLHEQQRPIIGNKFMEHEAGTDIPVEEQIYSPLIELYNKNFDFKVHTEKVAFVINSENNNYHLTETDRPTGFRSFAKNNTFENRVISIKHPVNHKLVTGKRIAEIVSTGAFWQTEGISENQIDQQLYENTLFCAKGIAGQYIAETGRPDNPIFSMNVYSDSSSTNAYDVMYSRVSLGGTTADETWFNVNIGLKIDFSKNEYYTLIVEVSALFEVLP